MNKPEQEFIDHLRLVRHYSEKTALSYQEDIDIFCDFIFQEGVLMEDVDVIVIRNFLTEELNRGVSKRSCKRRLSSLKHFYKFMVNRGRFSTTWSGTSYSSRDTSTTIRMNKKGNALFLFCDIVSQDVAEMTGAQSVRPALRQYRICVVHQHA